MLHISNLISFQDSRALKRLERTRMASAPTAHLIWLETFGSMSQIGMTKCFTQTPRPRIPPARRPERSISCAVDRGGRTIQPSIRMTASTRRRMGLEFLLSVFAVHSTRDYFQRKNENSRSLNYLDRMHHCELWADNFRANHPARGHGHRHGDQRLADRDCNRIPNPFANLDSSTICGIRDETWPK